MDANVEPVIGREVKIINATHAHAGELGIVTSFKDDIGQWTVRMTNCQHGREFVFALPEELQFTQVITSNNQTGEDTTQQSGEIESLNVISNIVQPKKRGGARPGAGRPKGRLDDKTVDRLRTQKAIIDRIHVHADEMLNVALNKARGETYLMRKVTERDSKGKVTRVYHEIVDDPHTIIEYLDSDQDGSFGEEDEWYYMTTKPGSMDAIKDLYDRAFGKAAQTINADLTSKGEKLAMTDTQAEQLLRLRAKRAA